MRIEAMLGGLMPTAVKEWRAFARDMFAFEANGANRRRRLKASSQ